MKPSSIKIAIGIIILAIIVLALVRAPKAKDSAVPQPIPSSTELTSREAALLCTTDMATQYHVHPVLHIVINGQKQLIPEKIGINPGCMTSIHTHSADGVIHVESPVAKDFTLGDFFAVWKKDFSRDSILGHTVTDATEIVVTVNGETVDTYEDTILRDKDRIVISYQSK